MSEIPHAFLGLPFLAGRPIRSCALLEGGRTNRNYRLAADDQVYFLRLGAPEELGHGSGREREYTAIGILHEADLGPAPVYFDPPSRIIATEFVEAPTWSLEQVRTPENLAFFAEAVAALHRLDSKDTKYDVLAVSRRYIAQLRRGDTVATTDLDLLAKICRGLEELQDPSDLGMCHNDLWYGNFLATKRTGFGGIRFIDLEMAGHGDVYFDLAGFVWFHQLDPAQTELFLDTYAARSGRTVSTDKLGRMRAALHLRECLWALTQTASGLDDPFYTQCSQRHLDDLRRLKQA